MKNHFARRFFSLALALVMVLGMLPMSSITASAASASAPSVNGNSIYANGTPLYIVAGTT